MPKPGYYAVAAGRNVGIYRTWDECQAQINGYSNARFKKFHSDGEAQKFIDTHTRQQSTQQHTANNNTTGSQKRYTGPRTHQSAPAASSVPQNNTNKNKRPYPYLANQKAKQRRAEPATITVSNTAHTSSISPSDGDYFFVSIHFDGGARGNPGVAGSGAVVVMQNYPPVMSTTAHRPSQQQHHAPNWKRTIHICDFVGDKQTNNYAEYRGLLAGLTIVKRELHLHSQRKSNAASTRSPRHVDLVLQGDSNLIIQQLQGVWRCNNVGLQPLYEQSKRLLHEIQQTTNKSSIRLEHVYRDQNKAADRLANLAMDTKQSFMTTDDDEHNTRTPFAL